MQPKRPNNALKNRHTCYIARSGGGKTLAVNQLDMIKPTDQAVLWDPHSDHESLCGRKVRRYTDLKSFYLAVVRARKSTQGFKIALTLPETRKNFIAFCELVKSVGDGHHKKQIHVVCEEVPQVVETSGREKGVFGWLMTVGRKYGFIVHALGQRAAEMPKTVISNCAFKWIGVQDTPLDIERVVKEVGISRKDAEAMEELDYYLKGFGVNNLKKGRLTIPKH